VRTHFKISTVPNQIIQPECDEKLSWSSISSVLAKLQSGQFRVQILVGARDFSSPNCPDQLRDLPSLQFNGYKGFLPMSKAVGV
jgi:hypothetical protein